MRPGVFSGLDIEQPHDTELVANLPRHIRETRRALSVIKVLRVNFEPGTERGDLVFPNKEDGVWLRSHGAMPERQRFYGVAFPEDRAVIVGAVTICPDWNWLIGENLYIDDTQYGKMTHRNTGLLAGLAVTNKLVMFNLFVQEFGQILENLAEWIKNQQVEIDNVLDYLRRFEENLSDYLAQIEQGAKDALEEFRDARDEIFDEINRIEPLLKERTHTFVSIQPIRHRLIQPLINNFFSVPQYRYEAVTIIIFLNGILTNAFNLVGEPKKDSTLIQFTEPIPLGTEITGLVIGHPISQTVPVYVATDDSLIGTGVVPEPIGIAPEILDDISRGVHSVDWIGPTENTRNVALIQFLLLSEFDALKEQGKLVPNRRYIIIDAAPDDKMFIKQLEYQVTDSTAQLHVFKEATARPTEATEILDIPIVSEEAAGFMTAGAYKALQEALAKIDLLEGVGDIYISINPIPKDADNEYLTNLWRELAGKGPDDYPKDGDTLDDIQNLLRWVYRGGKWFGPASTLVSLATNEKPGIVRGRVDLPANIGKVYVEMDGSMTVIGWDDLVSKMSVLEEYVNITIEGIARARLWTLERLVTLPYVAGTPIATYPYKYGAEALAVYVQGIRTEQYLEVSKAPSPTSTEITLPFDIAMNDNGFLIVNIDCFV